MNVALLGSLMTRDDASLAFDNPSSVTAGTATGTPSSVTSNEVTTTIGQRVVLRFSQSVGSAGTPTSSPTLTGVGGTDDFSAIDETDMTAHEGANHRDDADESGVAVYIYSWVSTINGTGSFTATFSGTFWNGMFEATVLPACDVIDSAIDTGNNAATTVTPTLAGTPDEDDLVLTICNVRISTAYSVPSGFTGETNYSGSSGNRVQTAYDNGGAVAGTAWTGLSSSRPVIAANIQLRRT